MRIILGKRELKITSASIRRTMDTGADEFSCLIPMPDPDPDIDQELYNLVKPRSLTDSEVWIGNKKLLTGNLYKRSPSLTNSGAQLQLTGYSKTYRLIKSNPKEQREFLNQSLLEIAKSFALPFGLSVVSESVDAEINEKFENEKISATDTVFNFLQNLARQRGILISNDIHGNILFHRACTQQKTVGSIVEGRDGEIPLTSNFSASFDDSNLFQVYQSVADAPWAFESNEPGGISKDDRIKIPSFKTVQANSNVEGAGQKTVDFARNQTIAKGLSIPFQANTWYAPNGELWQENTLVSIESPTLFIPNGFTFLIKDVEYNLDSSGGETAALSLVPPALYTGGEIIEPWV